MDDHNFLNTLDVFSTTQFLKINRQSAYKTKIGGIFTLIFITLIILIFVMRIDSRSRGQRMTYKSEQRFNNNDIAILNTSPQSNNNFMLGVLISSQLNQQGYGLDNFDVSIDVITVTKDANGDKDRNTTTYSLQTCTTDHWKVTPQIQQRYQKQYSSKNFLCLEKNQVINLQAGDIQQYCQIKIQKCSGQDCENQTQIDQILKNRQFTVQTIFVNSYISTNELKYKTYYLQTLQWMYFDNKKYLQINLLFSQYDVTTDRNYLVPISENKISRQEGVFLKKKSDPFQTTWVETQIDQFFAKFTIKSSSQKTILHRIDQRLIDIISYIGGLAATIFSIFQVIMSNYSSYAFEVEISRKIFKESSEDNLQQKSDQTQKVKDKQAKPVKHYLTNFCQYVKDKVGCCFKSQKNNNQYRKEFDKHIDIELIIQKFVVFQKIITKFAQNKLINLKQIQKCHTFQEAHQFINYLSLFFYKQPDDNQQQKQHTNNHRPASSVNLYKGPLEINLNPYNQEKISRDSDRQNNGYDQNDGHKTEKRSQIYSQMNNDNLGSRDMINNEKDKYMK